MRRLFILSLSIISISNNSDSQGTISREDYTRAISFLWQNLNNKKVFNTNVEANWFADSSGVGFVTQNKEGKWFRKYEFRKKKQEPLFEHKRLADTIAALLKKEVKYTDLPVSSIKYINLTQIELSVHGKEYLLDLGNYKLNPKKNELQTPFVAKSPDGQWIAYSQNYNLYVKSTMDGTIKQMSTAGYKNYEYASYYGWSDIMEGESGERPARFAVNWSPDSKWIQTYVCDLRSGNKMYLLDWSIENKYRPKLLSYYRASPGDTNMVYMIPVFFNVSTGQEIRKDDMRSTHTNPISYEWSKKEPGFIYEENLVRGYQEVDLYRYDLSKNLQEKLYSEFSKTNIDTYNSWINEAGGHIIIASEKDGWRQLYAIDTKDKQLRPITAGNYFVNDILYSDNKRRSLIFSASGKEAGRNPYYNHTYKINLDGTGLSLLTPENANHDVSVSPDGKYLFDNFSAPDQPTKTILRETATGKIVAVVSTAITDELFSMKYSFPETFTAIGRDGTTIIYGALWKPSNFDPSKKYPVIDQSYTGPHTNMFPRNFTASLARSNQALAELGFIVVTVDGLGTAGRSKAFHNFSYKNMGKNLTDHMLAIKELAKKYSWVDADRVGIYGHSAGGYDAGHALLEFPEFYKVAVASSADHDFRMEKDWWPEMYMGWPVDSSYHMVSNITLAGNLKGKLLITHGGIDENVNPSATFKLAEALVKADKEFDMLIFPSQRHGYTGKANDYFIKKRWNYFVEHLLGVKPIWDFELK